MRERVRKPQPRLVLQNCDSCNAAQARSFAALCVFNAIALLKRGRFTRADGPNARIKQQCKQNCAPATATAATAMDAFPFRNNQATLYYYYPPAETRVEGEEGARHDSIVKSITMTRRLRNRGLFLSRKGVWRLVDNLARWQLARLAIKIVRCLSSSFVHRRTTSRA